MSSAVPGAIEHTEGSSQTKWYGRGREGAGEDDALVSPSDNSCYGRLPAGGEQVEYTYGVVTDQRRSLGETAQLIRKKSQLYVVKIIYERCEHEAKGFIVRACLDKAKGKVTE
jgi:hypothetical protein